MKREVTSLIAAAIFVLNPVLPSIAAEQRQSPADAGAAPAAGAPTSSAQLEKSWPRGYVAPSGAKIVIYQPQVASWDDQKHLVGYAAVAYQPKGELEKPALGTVKIETDTAVSLSERLIRFSTLKLTEVNFQSLPKEQ